MAPFPFPAHLDDEQVFRIRLSDKADECGKWGAGPQP